MHVGWEVVVAPLNKVIWMGYIEMTMFNRDLKEVEGVSYGSDGKESACNAGDLGQEDSLEKGMLTHSSILAWRIPLDRGAGWATVHGVAKSWT